jgi:WD40 repeat protein
MRGKICMLLCVILVLSVASVGAQNAWFAVDGKLLSFNSGKKIAEMKKLEKEVGCVFGKLGKSGTLVIGLGKIVIAPNDKVEKGMNLALYDPSMGKTSVIVKDVIRAYPAPSGNAIAVLSLDFTFRIYEDGKLKETGIKERGLQAAWFPDGKKFVFAAYPEDWTPEKMASPESQEEFFRLTNADLFIYDIESREKSPLVIHKELDYNPVISPDGKKIIFVSTRTHYASFYEVDINGENLKQLTNFDAKNIRGKLCPVPLLDKVVWTKSQGRLFYETNAKDLSPEIRFLSADGKKAEFIVNGKELRILDDKTAVFLDKSDVPQILKISSDK